MKIVYYLCILAIPLTIYLALDHSGYWIVLTYLCFFAGVGLEEILYDDPVTGERSL